MQLVREISLPFTGDPDWGADYLTTLSDDDFLQLPAGWSGVRISLAFAGSDYTPKNHGDATYSYQLIRRWRAKNMVFRGETDLVTGAVVGHIYDDVPPAQGQVRQSVPAEVAVRLPATPSSTPAGATKLLVFMEGI